MRNPFAPFEVDRVEHSATSSPDADRAAEEAQARLVEVVVRHADVRAAIKILRPLLEVEAAAFEQADAASQLQQPSRQREAGDTGADDADVALGNRGVALLAQVDQHCGWAAVPDASGAAVPVSAGPF